MYTKQDFKTGDRSPIEKRQLQFCKRYLEVNNKATGGGGANKASNLACRLYQLMRKL